MVNTSDGYYSVAVHPSYISTWYNSNYHRKSRPSGYDSFEYLNNGLNEQSSSSAAELSGLSGANPCNRSASLENLKHNKHHGTLSPMAVRKIKKAIDYTVYLAKPAASKVHYRGKDMAFCLNFITLTLSSAQIHTDNEIKKKIFQPLLNHFRQHYHIKNYVWVIEKQKNGNTHFHMVTDKFIPHQDLRNAWNKYQQELGYVTQYAAAQREWHKNGFQVRPELLKKWDYSAQYNAWKSGCRTHWNSPNSTDVHSLRLINNVRAYMVKYMTKNTQEDKKAQDFTPRNVESVLKNDQSFKEITGRIWGCSENLSNIPGARDDMAGILSEEMNKLFEDKSLHSFSSVYFSIVYCDISKLFEMGYRYIPLIFEQFLCLHFPDYPRQQSFVLTQNAHTHI